MKLLYCIKSLHNSGGMERVLTVKANWLCDHGYDVCIVTERQKGRKPFFALDPRVKTVDLGDRTRYSGGFRSKLKQAVSEIAPDICISLCGRDVYSLPAVSGHTPCLAEYHFSHDKFFVKYSGALMWPYAWLRTYLMERALQKFDCTVTLTQSDVPVWASVTRNVRQIYNPITAVCGSGLCQDTMGGTDVMPLSDLSAKRIIAAGRLEDQKNFSELVEAWGTVSAGHPDWRLDIFGEGSQRGALLQLVSRLGLEGKVRLCGTTDDIMTEYVRSSAVVMSSKHEGFPLVLVEGSACGLPLISYDCPTGPSEIIEDGVNGFLVPMGDTAKLAAAIERVISDDALRAEMGAAAFETSRRFTLPFIMGRWTALFSELSENR